MNILAIAASKGGVAKSTTALNLATIYSRSRRVLLVDCDPQGAIAGMMGIEAALGLSDVLGAAQIGAVRAKDAIQTTSKNLDVLTAGDALASTELGLVNRLSRESTLKKALATVAGSYDLCILDSPPSLNLLQVNVLVAATHLVIPTQAEITSLRTLADFLKVIQTVKDDLNPKLKLLGIVLTFFNPTYTHNVEALGLIEDAGHHVFSSKIGRSIRVASSANDGRAIVDSEPTNPRAAEYESLAIEIDKLI